MDAKQQPEQRPEQQSLFEAEPRWFHIFKHMIDCGDIAKMSATAVVVYLVIKAHTNMATGDSFPGMDRIAAYAGISVPTAKRAVAELVEYGYVVRDKRGGRGNHYTVREKLTVYNDFGKPAALATWDYQGTGIKAALRELKEVMMHGQFGETRIVKIEKLVVNVQVNNAPGNVQINTSNEDFVLSESEFQRLKPDLQDMLLAIRENIQKTVKSA